MKLLVLSDSLTLPRNQEADQVLDYDETWPCLLESRNPTLQIARVGIGSGTSSDILYQTRYWTAFNPNHTIVQVGICDALPRAFHLYEVEMLKKLPFGRFVRMWTSKSSRYLRRWRRITLTTKSQFRSNIRQIQQKLPNVIWIGIASKSNDPVHLPGAMKNIREYNSIIENEMNERFISLATLPDTALMSDQFHLTAEGHKQVAKLVESRIGKI